MLHEYSLFQIPALLVIAIVGALIPYGIYEYVRKTPQPGTEPGTEPGTAETVNTFNVNSILGWVSLSI